MERRLTPYFANDWMGNGSVKMWKRKGLTTSKDVHGGAQVDSVTLYVM